jgi:hypothetical protein
VLQDGDQLAVRDVAHMELQEAVAEGAGQHLRVAGQRQTWQRIAIAMALLHQRFWLF